MEPSTVGAPLTSSCSLVGSGERSGTGRPGGSSKGSSRMTVWLILQTGHFHSENLLRDI